MTGPFLVRSLVTVLRDHIPGKITALVYGVLT
ncbi:hypothetical protein CLV88_105204 [Shimia abyssi]|uniref:Uncharacterized protein n=1 Tax=Shimia abyssi TaxID=1662395 RepID=A0A2P8FDJ2_9RHOB|nr:hypothetical protein CLV88_105204 [Shimia abyssi]